MASSPSPTRAGESGESGNRQSPKGSLPSTPQSADREGSLSQTVKAVTKEIFLLHGEDRVQKAKRTHWSVPDFLLGTRRGQVVTLALLFLVLIFVGALSWMATGGLDGMYDTSLLQSLWFSWGMFFDPGTQMGFPADSEVKFKVTAVVFSIAGFMYNLLILGIIVEGARVVLDTLHKQRNRIVQNGHSLVLGWSDKTLFLLREMVALAQNKGEFKKIVILAEEDEMTMSSKIRRHFPNAADRRHFICRRGCPYECDELYKASAVSAHDIIILGSKLKQESDLDAIRIVVALAALPEQPSGNIIAEVRMPETACVLRSIFSSADGLLARGPVNRLLCLMALDPIVGDCLATLVSFISGEEFYLVKKEASPEVASCETFGQVSRCLRGGICVGVDPPGDAAIFSPPDDYRIGPEDKLLVLAHSEGELKNRGRGFGVFLNKKMSDTSDCRMTTKSMQLEIDASSYRKIIIIIGWSSDMSERLLMLDEYATTGTLVHILCNIPKEEQASELESGLFRFDNIELEHHCGSVTSVRKLAKLPLAKASAILILADECWQADQSSHSDSSCLAAVVTINQLCQGKYPEYPGCESKARIICEILDPRTDRVLSTKTGHDLSETATFFNSNAVETGIFAMAAAELAVYNALVILLQRNDRGNVVCAPVESYVRPEEMDQIAGHFGALSERVRERGEVLLGWHQVSSSETVLNPGRDSFAPLSAGDKVIVVRKLQRHYAQGEF